MFVLLEHQVPPTAAGGATLPAGMHWDLMIELPGAVRLSTWRLALNPLATAGEIPAERLVNHRRVYLDFEGDIGGGRGAVRRLDRGEATVLAVNDAAFRVLLDGSQLRGVYEIRSGAGRDGTLRRIEER